MQFASTLPMPAQTLALSRYDVACRALAEAKAVDDIVEIVGQANAVHAYARQAKNRQMEIDAAEIRIRAERRLGELMAAQASAVGKAKPPGSNQHRVIFKPDAPPTLAEAGIDKNLAHRARTLAAVPQEKFEQRLTDKRQSQEVIGVEGGGGCAGVVLKLGVFDLGAVSDPDLAVYPDEDKVGVIAGYTNPSVETIRGWVDVR